MNKFRLRAGSNEEGCWRKETGVEEMGEGRYSRQGRGWVLPGAQMPLFDGRSFLVSPKMQDIARPQTKEMAGLPQVAANLDPGGDVILRDGVVSRALEYPGLPGVLHTGTGRKAAS